jgi:hypothetical protein
VQKIAGGLVAASVIAAALWVLWPEQVSRQVTRWFGPPQVELEETYGAVEGGDVFDHSGFDQLLGDHVDGEGFVDYRRLAGRTSELDAYIASIGAANLDSLGRDERLALLINAYNAYTLRLILDYYPIDSIRDIPGEERWDAERWVLGGETVSLNQLEHEVIRPNFREPRIHFALVCAAIGCPPLRTEAYTGERLEEQLETQTRFTHASERWVVYRPDDDLIELTSLYDWYRGDFEQVAGSILDYVALYREDLRLGLQTGLDIKVRFLDYDWSLNERDSG